MTMNRVQFQPGLSMAEFLDRYGSDDKCEAALIESRWPAGFACPACGCGQSSSFRRRVSGILCAGHSMTKRSMYANQQEDDEGGDGRGGGDAFDPQGTD